MSRFRAVFGASFVVAGLAGATACGSGFLDGLTGGKVDNSSVTPGVDAARVNIGCVGRVPPDASTGADGPSVAPLTVAFQTIRISANPNLDSGAPPPVGYNLDHLCTCGEDRTPSCVPPDGGATPRSETCDDDGGTDNALAAFFNVLATAVPEFREDFASQRINDGVFTVLVDINNWNGLPEDPQVLVRVRMSPGIDRDATGRRKPLFDGTDIWQVDPGSIVQGNVNIGKDCRAAPTDGICTATIADPHAFVTNGRLVAHPANVEGRAPIVLQSSVGRITINLSDTTLDAELTPIAGGRWRMTGEITGRWPVESVLNTVANIENPLLPTTGVCETANAPQSAYAVLKVGVCAGLDLGASPDLDRDPLSPCTAVSSAITFVGSTAAVGHIVDSPPNSANCLAWKDDCAQ